MDDLEKTLAAGNRSTPAALLAALATDPDPKVRWYVASNPSTPRAVLDTLANDPADDVREVAAFNISLG